MPVQIQRLQLGNQHRPQEQGEGSSFALNITTNNSMKASYVAALCLLGSLLVPAVMADLPTAMPTMMFSEWFHALKAGAPSRARLMNDYSKPETKHICLQETRQYNCRYIGCPNVEAFDELAERCEGARVCTNCRQGTAFQ